MARLGTCRANAIIRRMESHPSYQSKWVSSQDLSITTSFLHPHPPHLPHPPRIPHKSSFYTQDHGSIHTYVYCNCVTHRSWECDSVTSPAERRQILQSKRLCFICSGMQHSVSQCRGHVSCTYSKKKALLVHLRLFDNSWMPNNKQWWSGLSCNPIRRENVSSIVLVKVNGLIRRALLDTLATASHASGYISDWLNVALSYSLICWIQTVVQVQVSDTKGNYTITLRENWVDHAELLCMENLNYREIIRKYHHLKGADIEDTDTKSLLLLHVNLGMSDYVEIKTQSL